MTHSKRKLSDPYRNNVIYLMTGLLWGLFAGLGVSFIISMQTGRSSELLNRPARNRTKAQEMEPVRTQQPSSRNRNTPAKRRLTKNAGTNLAASKIQTQEQRSSDEPADNDSLGG